LKLAFCLFRYFPYGGLQHDFMRIAKTCVARGHEVHVYTMRWEGEMDPALPVTILPTSGLQNHTRIRYFGEAFSKILKQKNYDRIVGFNKMPGLDVYFAGDPCFRAKLQKQHPSWFRLLPRYRVLLANEAAVFSAAHTTKILLIAPNQQNEFVHHYGTPSERFYMLPPGISKDYMAPSNANEIRQQWRKQHQLNDNDLLMLFVGSDFRRKGLDRVLKSIAALSPNVRERTRLFVIGQDRAKKYIQQIKSLAIEQHVQFLGGRNDVVQFMLTADLLIHPARSEPGGMILLEAITSGLPVLTTDVCGHAHYVTEANAGKVLASPFDQMNLNQMLEDMLISDNTQRKQNGINFAAQNDLYSLPDCAAQLIESLR